MGFRLGENSLVVGLGNEYLLGRPCEHYCVSVCIKNISSLYGVDLKEKWHPIGGKGFDHCWALSFWSFIILFYVTA